MTVPRLALGKLTAELLKMISARRLLPFALALPMIVVFTSMGFWQLQRLSSRRSTNEQLEAALDLPPIILPVAADETPPSVNEIIGRRVEVTGIWDSRHEIIVRGQAYLGTPGVLVLTPLQIDSGDALLIMRGWLPAADGLSANLAAATPAASSKTVTVRGLVRPGQRPSEIPVLRVGYEDRTRPVLGTVDLAAADTLLPWQLADFYVQVLPDSVAQAAAAPGAPRPLPPPPLNDGPHALYAFQWFGFATIALAGAFLLPKARQTGPITNHRKGGGS